MAREADGLSRAYGDGPTAELLREGATLLRAAAQEREALERIIGMCDVPGHCACGRPNGLPAVVQRARAALTPTGGSK